MSTEYTIIPLSKHGKKNAGLFSATIDTKYAEEFTQFSWSVLQNRNTRYAMRIEKVDGKSTTILLHRAVMEKKLNRKLLPDEQIDHIDLDGLNCIEQNLRLATPSQNGMNQGYHRDAEVKYKGVTLDKRRKTYFARIMINRKSKHLGSFETAEEAHRAYCKAADEFHKDFKNYG